VGIIASLVLIEDVNIPLINELFGDTNGFKSFETFFEILALKTFFL
jgi:hypothetical protein